MIKKSVQEYGIDRLVHPWKIAEDVAVLGGVALVACYTGQAYRAVKRKVAPNDLMLPKEGDDE